MERERTRCPWCGDNPLYVRYHDQEWGVPVHDDRLHFEFLVLEGAQAGLSWLTILKRRDGYRRAFDKFNPKKVAAYGEADVARLLADEGIIRNRLKVHSAINNAKRFLEVQKEFGSFDAYIWSFMGGRPLVNARKTLAEIPAKTEKSDEISRDLKKRGFNFVGSVIIYAHMQAIGLVNDHLVHCFRYGELKAAGRL